jgi:hypothetical protein
MDLMSFNIKNYLNDKSIHYDTHGKNVTPGWINIQCVYPECDDISNHLGINLTTNLHSCWKCGNKGGIPKLIQLIEHCSYYQAKEIERNYSDNFSISSPLVIRKTYDNDICELPKESLNKLPNLHKKYLISRGFEPDLMQNKYKISACYLSGKYKYRMIIPIFYNNEIVSFIGRDVTEKASIKYLTCPDKKAIIPGNELLYNINTSSQNIVIVEGIMDAWRIGNKAIATLTTQITEEKIRILSQKNIQKAFILLDNGAERLAHKVAKKLSCIIPHVETISLPWGDPDEYFLKNPNDLKELYYILE